MEDSALAADPSLLDSLAAAAATDPAAVGSGPALEAAWAWALEHPLEVEVSFVRPGGPSPADGQPAFDAVFRGAPVVAGTAADSAALRAYAVRLRDLTAARDTAALLAEFAPAIGDNFEAVGGEAVMDRATYDARNRAAVVLGEIEPFEAEDVRLRSWSGGRVWELYRPSGPLLRRGPTVRSVYVGEVGGRLRVVRR